MKSLGNEESERIAQEFANFIKFVEQIHDINSVILGFNNMPSPILANKPIQNSIYSLNETDYSTGCFMSKNLLSVNGVLFENKEAGMDYLYPLIYTNNYLFIYSGFEIDEIIHFYPAKLIINKSFTPLARE